MKRLMFCVAMVAACVFMVPQVHADTTDTDYINVTVMVESWIELSIDQKAVEVNITDSSGGSASTVATVLCNSPWKLSASPLNNNGGMTGSVELVGGNDVYPEASVYGSAVKTASDGDDVGVNIFVNAFDSNNEYLCPNSDPNDFHYLAVITLTASIDN